MTYRTVLLLLSILLVLSSCAGLQYTDSVQARDITQTTDAEATTRVLANAGEWRNSGVIVRHGLRYRVTATGRWSAGIVGCNWTGPDGVGAGFWCASGSYVSRGSGSLLIAKVGEEGTPFAVGDVVEFMADRDGILFFSINDVLLADNDGAVQVKTALVGSEAESTARPPSPSKAPEGTVSILLSYPPPDSRVDKPVVVLAGMVTGPTEIASVEVAVNGRPLAPPAPTRESVRVLPLSHQVPLEPGENVIVINARDHLGRFAQKVVRVVRVVETSVTASSAGSGFLLRDTNLVMTNDHVVAGKTTIAVVFPGGEEYPGRVVLRDRGNDLALVELKGRGGGSGGLTLAVNAEIQVGDTVHALGYPLGGGLSRQPSMVSGAISSTLGLGDDIARFRMTAPINPGNSGGPIVNHRGQVVGIAAAGLVRQEVEAIRFGIKASTAALILRQAGAATSFDVVVTPTEPSAKSPAQIFRDVSPHVVLIEAR